MKGEAAHVRATWTGFIWWYRALALALLNFILLLVLFNLALGAVFAVRDYVTEPAAPVDKRVSTYRAKFADLDAYKRISPAVASQYLDEQDAMGSLGFEYEPWIQFRNPEYHGTLLNTDSRGLRRTREPKSLNGGVVKIHVFGGSTTFGYGVPDAYTIPSHLQAILERMYPATAVLVKNFGQGYYFSSQELLQFLRTTKEGDVPDWAVFIDGGNDTSQMASRQDEPWFTPAMRQLWNAKRGMTSETQQARMDLSWIPMVRLATAVRARLAPVAQAGAQHDTAAGAPAARVIWSDSHLSDEMRDKMVEYVVSRYTTNLRLIRAVCKEFGINCLFVWQPHPGYKYDRTLHKAFPFPGEVPQYWLRVYARMESYQRADFLYLGDMLEHESGKVYVDDVHYNETTNERIAARIGERIDLDRGRAGAGSHARSAANPDRAKLTGEGHLR